MSRSIVALLLTLAAHAVASEAVQDVCSDCHDAPPVPAEHPVVAETRPETCGACHEAAPGDPYLEAVHGEHLELGLGCDFCHGEAAPTMERLEALTNP